MSEPASTPSPPDPFIGWAFRYLNPGLNIDLFGSPVELLRHMKQRQVNVKSLTHDLGTHITANAVRKNGRVGKFPGGPNALGLMRLLDATAARNWDAARQTLAEFPALLSPGHEAASVPLCLNAALGQNETISFLLANGASPNLAGQLGMAPLHWAATYDQPETATLLLQAGAKRASLNWFILSPANLACANGSFATLQRLTNRNPDASKPSVEAVIHTMEILGEK